MTVARTGPTSAISAKKSRNAAAEQTTARPTTDSTTCADGICPGHRNAASGAYATAEEADPAPAAEPLALTRQRDDQGADERDGRDQQPGQRARQLRLGAGEQ